MAPSVPRLLLAVTCAALAARPEAQSTRVRGAPGATGAVAPGGAQPAPPGPIRLELAGASLAAYPHFEFTRSFNAGAPVEVAIDPSLHPALVGVTADLYVVDARGPGGWAASPVLVDRSGGPETVTFSGAGIAANRFVVDAGTLSGDAGAGLGVPYDVVVDLDRNGLLDPTDLIDGRTGEPGFFVVHDLTAPGPYPVTEITYSGGSFLGQNTFYPTNVDELGLLPLVVISHGNGHNYLWYDHIGLHLASYGFVVMSHQNNTSPGPNAASLTTLSNTDWFLSNLDTIAGGVLRNHVDGHRIAWIGHSRGGEGVNRAYQRMLDGIAGVSAFGLEDIALISSIAPTDFYGPNSSNPHGVPFHLWTGGADNDVNGCANCGVCETFHFYDRAERTRFSISLHGVGHGDFHNGGGGSVAAGPCLVGRPTTHEIVRGEVLALAQYVLKGEVAASDYLWRQWERFRPIGGPTGSCVVVDHMFRPGPEAGTLVLDDYQTNFAADLSSSGGAVSWTVQELLEDRLDDGNTSFTDTVLDPMNGMTQGRPSDVGRGVVFEFDGLGDYTYVEELPAGSRDVRGYAYLSFRAAQATRHPLTTGQLGDLVFEVRLRDGAGATSTIEIGVYGGGIEEPYQRTGCGTGAGWGNEFETIRIRLTDFTHDGSGLDLSDLAAVELLFGPSHGSASGRLGLDDLQLEPR